MKKVNSLHFLFVVGVCMIVGCSSPRPELMPQTERDKLTYQDKGAMIQREDVSFRIAVCVDQKEYERYPKAGDAVETQMAEAVSIFVKSNHLVWIVTKKIKSLYHLNNVAFSPDGSF